MGGILQNPHMPHSNSGSMSDQSPLFFSVTVQSSYNATSLKSCGVKVYFVNPGLHLLGLLTMKSPNANDIRTYNLERTICDVLRSRNQIDVQFANEALKKNVIHKDRNIDQLYNYAKQFKIQKIGREYIEVLL
jgi:hypothetical protein